MVEGVEKLALQATQTVKQALKGKKEQVKRIKLKKQKFFSTVPFKTLKHFKHTK